MSGGLSVPIMGAGSGSASLNTSKDKMDSHYASVKEQSGIFAGEGGFDVHTGNHTQLNGGVIASTATADKNHLDTGTLGFSDIDNHADYRVSHQGMGISTGQFSGGASLAGITRGLASNAASSILSGLSDSGHADSTTHAAISEGSITVRDKANQQQDVNSLSRDTDHANQGLSPIFDKEKAQQRLAESQRISEIGGQVADIVRTNGEIQAAKAKQDPSERAKAAAALKASGKAVTDAAIDNKITESVMQRYGTGSDLQRGIQAATAALQGLAGGNLTAAALDASSPYIAGLIHNATTTDSQGHSEVNTAANLAAHALVNVAVALAEGGNSRDALSRASGAVTGEAIGMMAKAYYNKDAKDLTEQERQTVSALATAAAGLAGGLVGDSTASAATAAQAGKNAVENNLFFIPPLVAAGEATAACFATGPCAAIVAGAATGVAGNEVINQAKKKADETGAPNKTELPIEDKDPTGGKLVNPAAEEKKDPTLSTPDQSEAQGATHTGNTEGNPDTGGNTTSTPVADEPSKDDLAYQSEISRPENMSPEGAGRAGAFNEAKRKSGIPVSQSPTNVYPNVDKRNKPQPGYIYEFEVPKSGGGTQKIYIRDDAAGHFFSDDSSQNRGRHFNDEKGNHYDY